MRKQRNKKNLIQILVVEALRDKVSYLRSSIQCLTEFKNRF